MNFHSFCFVPVSHTEQISTRFKKDDESHIRISVNNNKGDKSKQCITQQFAMGQIQNLLPALCRLRFFLICWISGTLLSHVRVLQGGNISVQCGQCWEHRPLLIPTSRESSSLSAPASQDGQCLLALPSLHAEKQL